MNSCVRGKGKEKRAQGRIGKINRRKEVGDKLKEKIKASGNTHKKKSRARKTE
ncbi:hypothetical protein [Nonomuraea rubra]|uniref:hypothetical protein n=1 Tax=Nonomuraea rubra TaxID=46180 RepID=UPI0031F12A5E